MLQYKQFPYFFTILIALVAWTVDNISNEILNNRAVSYSLEYCKSNYNGYFKQYSGTEYKVVRCRLKNLTNDYLFKNLQFKFSIPSTEFTYTLAFKRISAEHPLDYKLRTENIIKNSSKTSVEIPGLHPKTSCIIEIFYTGKKQPMFFLEYSNRSKINEKEAILLLKDGIRTFILDHKIQIYLWLLSIWTILIVWYLKKIK